MAAVYWYKFIENLLLTSKSSMISFFQHVRYLVLYISSFQRFLRRLSLTFFTSTHVPCASLSLLGCLYDPWRNEDGRGMVTSWWCSQEGEDRKRKGETNGRCRPTAAGWKRETVREKERWHAQCGYWFTAAAEAGRRPRVNSSWVRRLVSPEIYKLSASYPSPVALCPHLILLARSVHKSHFQYDTSIFFYLPKNLFL